MFISGVNITFQQLSYAVSEDDGMVPVCVKIDGVSADGLERNLTVSLSHKDIQSAGYQQQIFFK